MSLETGAAIVGEKKNVYYQALFTIARHFLGNFYQNSEQSEDGSHFYKGTTGNESFNNETPDEYFSNITNLELEKVSSVNYWRNGMGYQV